MPSLVLPGIPVSPYHHLRLGVGSWEGSATGGRVGPASPLQGIRQQGCGAGRAMPVEAEERSPVQETRRAALAAMSSAASLYVFSDFELSAHAADVQPPSAESIADLIDRANPGDTVMVPAGVYREKLTITKPLTLEAEGSGTVEVLWQTQDHYEPVLTCQSADGVVVKGMQFKHASPSVANNYAVFLQGGSVTLEGCQISSSTGTGVAAEGGEHVVRGCRLFGCERHGLAVFGTLDGDSCQLTIEQSSVEENKLNGVLVRDQGSLDLAGSCRVEGNGDHGVAVTYGSATISRAADISKNKNGGVFEGPGSDLVYVT